MDCPQGRPLFMRTPESKFTLANFMRSHLYANFATLKVEMDLLFQKEKDSTGTIATPDPKDVDGFNAYAKEFKDAIAIEQMAIEKYSVNQAP